MAIEKFPIEASHIMMFARAIGDPNAIYYDEDYAKSTELGGVIAPPTFTQAGAQFDPEWEQRPKFGEEWIGSAKGPTGISEGKAAFSGGGRLHAEQHFEYHQPIKAGDVLSTVVKPGKTWEKQGRRGGGMRFEEVVTEFFNQDKELVVTATNVVVYLDRPATPAKAEQP